MTELARGEAEFLLYLTKDGLTRVAVRSDGETAWLSLGQMAESCQPDKSVISRHVKNVFDEGELSPEATVAKSATVQREGEREVEYYNLDVIISVGYRVKSHRGTQFRIWATQRLREYIAEGATPDDEQLKHEGGTNDFNEARSTVRKLLHVMQQLLSTRGQRPLSGNRGQVAMSAILAGSSTRIGGSSARIGGSSARIGGSSARIGGARLASGGTRSGSGGARTW